MHLVETYALACGAKIDKPYVYETYFPVPQEKYITFQPFSKLDIKNYDYWQEVVDLLLPVLREEGVKIVQIGTAKEKLIKGCLGILGHTSINQAAYVIQRGELHFGADSFGVHMASAYGKKIMALYSNNKVENVGPYWSDEKDTVLLEPKRKGKPNYASHERPKSINTLKPEDITQSICDLLKIKFKKHYETIFVGEKYGEEDFFVFVPSSIYTSPPGFNKPLEIRMDYLFDEETLSRQLKSAKCSVVTDKPIDLEILKKGRPNIEFLFYEIKERDDPTFAQKARKLGLRIVLLSKLSEKELEKKKLDYIDVGKINLAVEPDTKLIQKLKDSKGLFYKSNKIIASDSLVFSSRPKYEKSLPYGKKAFEPIEKSDSFFDDLDHFHIVKLLD